MSNADRIGASATRPLQADEQLVCVSRDHNDGRTARVPLSRIRNPHHATDCGGTRELLPAKTLAVYAFCDEIPGVAHECGHAGRPHSIKVLVRPEETSAETLEMLEARAAGFKPRRRYRAG